MATGGVTVRDLAPDDINACVHIALAVWAPVFASYRTILGERPFHTVFPGWQQQKEAAIRSACAGEHGAMACVAERRGKVVGFVTFYCNHETGMGEISNNAVHPDFQGEGIGTRMYHHVCDRFRALGMRLARVSTGGDPSHAPARRAYEKAGFAVALPGVDYFQEL
jgi:GNAT superfamily N-acetyltransferase